MTQKYDRFKAAPWFQEGIKPPVLVGGAGGIGSWLTVLLNRAGFETYVFDFDVLEEINMAGQLFMHKSIGMTKVDALAEVTRLLCREEIIANLAKVDENTMTNEIVFAAFDNIQARKDTFTTWAQNYKGRHDAIFIDGRLTAEQLTIFSIRGDDELAILEYQTDELPDDSTIPELDCTLKQTSHGAAMIAAHMVEMFTNWYSGILGKDDSRNVPYFWEYIIPIGYCSQREAIGTAFHTDKYGTDLPVPDGYEMKDGLITPLQESKGLAVGIDTARTDDTPTDVAIVYGTAEEFSNNELFHDTFFRPVSAEQEIEQAQTELDRWATLNENIFPEVAPQTQTPDNSILEEEPGDVNPSENQEDNTHDGYDLP